MTWRYRMKLYAKYWRNNIFYFQMCQCYEYTLTYDHLNNLVKFKRILPFLSTIDRLIHVWSIKNITNLKRFTALPWHWTHTHRILFGYVNINILYLVSSWIHPLLFFLSSPRNFKNKFRMRFPYTKKINLLPNGFFQMRKKNSSQISRKIYGIDFSIKAKPNHII